MDFFNFKPTTIKEVWNNWKFKAIGQAMLNPIRRQIDYEGLSRRIFKVEPLPAKKDDPDGT